MNEFSEKELELLKKNLTNWLPSLRLSPGTNENSVAMKIMLELQNLHQLDLKLI